MKKLLVVDIVGGLSPLWRLPVPPCDKLGAVRPEDGRAGLFHQDFIFSSLCLLRATSSSDEGNNVHQQAARRTPNLSRGGHECKSVKDKRS